MALSEEDKEWIRQRKQKKAEALTKRQREKLERKQKKRERLTAEAAEFRELVGKVQEQLKTERATDNRLSEQRWQKMRRFCDQRGYLPLGFRELTNEELDSIGTPIPNSRLLRDFCCHCGEPIRVATVRNTHSCEQCGDERGSGGSGITPVELSEITYHGGRFHTGEW